MAGTPCTDPVLLGLWHPVSSDEELTTQGRIATCLLGSRLTLHRGSGNEVNAHLEDGSPLPVLRRYGYLWTSLSDSPAPLFEFQEFDEPDRRRVSTGVIGVHVSAGRAVENFLDMGHFPFVHTGILGEEPHTEVKDYEVKVTEDPDEILATQCRFWQPKAAVASGDGADVDYTYRVPHPNCALLYKSSPGDPERRDAIYLFLQPMGEELVRAHSGMCILDDTSSDSTIRSFQQIIFAQDKPILENQHPKRLPLDPRAETPIRADKSAIAYRRWLSGKGISYGVIPAGE